MFFFSNVYGYMRSADLATTLRIIMIFAAAYLLLVKPQYYAVAVFLIIVSFALDFVDGYLALGRKHNFFSYLSSEARGIKTYTKKDTEKLPKYGSAFDIAGDRITEYVLWLAFTFTGIVPIFVIFVIVTRNALSDAFTLSMKKNFHAMHSKFGKIASSHISRGIYGTTKALMFVYLSLIYALNLPLDIGYALIGIVVTYSLLRGAAEIYEALS